MPSPRKLLAAVGAALMATTVVTACGSPINGTGTKLGRPVPGTPQAQLPQLHDCTQQLLGLGVPTPSALKGTLQFQCGTLSVPLDYTHPDGTRINLAMVRIHTTQNTTTPVQSLLLNPGGPGGSGLNFGLGILGQLDPDVVRHYDLIAFDPRGVGESNPVRCLTDAQKDKFLAASPNTLTAAGVRAEEQLTRTFSHQCSASVGPSLRYYDTVDTARDMDQIRQAVGDDVMNYLGFSYGTELGWTYAHLFPKEVHTFVLDGAVDPTQVHNQNSTGQLKGFESAFGQFSAWCKHASSCSTLKNPTATVERVYAAAQRHPLHTDSSRDLTESLASTGVLEALYSKSEWPKLAAGLTAAVGGDGTGLLQLADRYNQRSADGSYQNIIDANATISCNDSPVHASPPVSKILARARSLQHRFPVFGTAAGGGPGCLGWQPHRTPVPSPSAATPEPVLVVGNLHDPATPYVGAVRLTRELGHAQLLSWDGEGHTSYLNGSSCIDGYVNDYLIHGTMPPEHKVCPAK